MGRLVLMLTEDRLKMAAAIAAQNALDLVCEHVDVKDGAIPQDELLRGLADEVVKAVRRVAVKNSQRRSRNYRRTPWRKSSRSNPLTGGRGSGGDR